MAKGELFIKTSATSQIQGNENGWVDAYDVWGVSFTDTALSSLMTPASVKKPVENKSRILDGKQVINDSNLTKKEERDVTLEMHIKAPTRLLFWQRYDAFCQQVLEKQFILIKSGYLSDRVFHMTYESCSQFSEWMQHIAKFTLRLNEPNPANRSE
jgi:hypothetical protein